MQPFSARTKKFLPPWLLSLCVMLLSLAACSVGGVQVGGANATATPNSVIYQNKLDGKDKANWNDDSTCGFKSDGYHVTAGFICLAPADKVGDAVYTVTVKQISGPDTYAFGLVFRHPSAGNYYDFQIDANGKWLFDKVVADKTTTIVDFTVNAAILKGLNQSNTISVQAQGSHFIFSVNGTQVGTADDTQFSSGDTGLAGNDGIEVVYTDFAITKIKA